MKQVNSKKSRFISQNLMLQWLNNRRDFDVIKLKANSKKLIAQVLLTLWSPKLSVP